MKNKKIFLIDVSLNSEETLLAYAKMWHRIGNVNWESLENELKIAKDKKEMVEVMTKYYGDFVDFIAGEYGDMNS
jgi:hypothetical protein